MLRTIPCVGLGGVCCAFPLETGGVSGLAAGGQRSDRWGHASYLTVEGEQTSVVCRCASPPGGGFGGHFVAVRYSPGSSCGSDECSSAAPRWSRRVIVVVFVGLVTGVGNTAGARDEPRLLSWGNASYRPEAHDRGVERGGGAAGTVRGPTVAVGRCNGPAVLAPGPHFANITHMGTKYTVYKLMVDTGIYRSVRSATGSFYTVLWC
jgi:hypothetical protein